MKVFSRCGCVRWRRGAYGCGSVGRVLASYRSGKLPKAFKIISTLKNWEEVRARWCWRRVTRDRSCS